MNTMKAVRLHRFGGPEALAVETLPIPSPVDDEVVVRVLAAGVNPVDFKIRKGDYPAVKESDLPVIIGRDASGIVEICGTRAKSFKKGDEVYALLGFDRGTYAGYISVKPNEAALKPRILDHAHAAAVPLAGLTAWQGLFTYGRLQAGQRVLIHGGAGGVGHFAVQFAKAAGAHVVTTVSTEDVEFVRSLGADQVIDYRKEQFDQKTEKVNLVFDLVAGPTQDRSWSVLRPGSTFVSTLSEPSQHRAQQLGVRALRYTVQPNSGQLAEIARLIDAGKVRPHVERSYTMTEAGEAQDHVEKRHVQGKLVVAMPDDHAPPSLPALEGL
jgi:NADPH:quinone reductase-like Zn-dependent oxidoreductase